MKRITWTLLGMVYLTGFAQTQRTILLEEFTQASCTQCAAANPTFNKLIANNSGKVVSIKYHTAFPGKDPMNEQNKQDAASRVNYYTIISTPQVSNDGKPTETPGSITQADINTEYTIPSPFKLDLIQHIDTVKDSIYITCTITAAQDFTTKGPLYFRQALVEKSIKFPKAPGTNGEKEFFSVMRKMYPSAVGTALSLTWTKDQVETLFFKDTIPSYIYNKQQLRVVGFLQTDNDKTVLQAAESTSLVTGIATIPADKNPFAVVYPNPMTEKATLALELLKADLVQFEVMNSLGQIIFSNDLGKLEVGKQMIVLNTATIPEGIYFLNISIGDAIISKKISITK